MSDYIPGLDWTAAMDLRYSFGYILYIIYYILYIIYYILYWLYIIYYIF